MDVEKEDEVGWCKRRGEDTEDRVTWRQLIGCGEETGGEEVHQCSRPGSDQ